MHDTLSALKSFVGWTYFIFFSFTSIFSRLHLTSNPAAARVSVSHINYPSVILFAFII